MDDKRIQNEYFLWMYEHVYPPIGASYHELLEYLHSVEFTWLIDLDGNRAEDGIDLRYRFGNEFGYKGPEIALYLDNRPCSILEMMVALSLRCEEYIMDDYEYGNRTGKWFLFMLQSLGLDGMDNEHFNRRKANTIISKFLNRTYAPNGKGGLFYLHDCREDLREIEIWYQLCRYLNTVIEEESR